MSPWSQLSSKLCDIMGFVSECVQQLLDRGGNFHSTSELYPTCHSQIQEGWKGELPCANPQAPIKPPALSYIQPAPATLFALRFQKKSFIALYVSRKSIVCLQSASLLGFLF